MRTASLASPPDHSQLSNIAREKRAGSGLGARLQHHNDVLNSAHICVLIHPPHPGPFHIDPTNGELILMESLDYETVTDYNFTITATDGGGLSDRSLVVVIVMDANDNRPRFEQDLYAVAVEEGDYSRSSINLLSVSYYTSVMEGIVGASACSVLTQTPVSHRCLIHLVCPGSSVSMALEMH